MKNTFGPWTTALNLSSPQRLDTFWKRRLTMLLPTSRTAPRLSRATILGILAAGILACLAPAVHYAPIQAQAPKDEADAKARGRIYVSASLRQQIGGKEERTNNLIIAIDPATGKWQKITDDGHCGRVSPDRLTLVFNRGISSEIWNCDTGGTNNPAKISDKSGRPIWSPDGKYLVATKAEILDDRWKDETWRMEAPYGANPVQLAIPETDSVEDWSADGQWFVTCSDRHPPHGSGYQLYIMKTDGTQQRRLTKGGLNCYSRFSPDGCWIVYTHQTGKDGNSIWVVDMDGKNAKEIIKEVDLASPDSAFWSPDGKQLAVVFFNWSLNEKGERILADAEKANFRLEIMDADGKNRRELKLADAKFVFIGALGDWR
jgi:Tol biopolymer transport system component